MTNKKQKKAVARRKAVTKEANIQRNKSKSQKEQRAEEKERRKALVKEALAKKVEEEALAKLEMSAQRTAEISSLLHSADETLRVRHLLANLNKTYEGVQA